MVGSVYSEDKSQPVQQLLNQETASTFIKQEPHDSIERRGGDVDLLPCDHLPDIRHGHLLDLDQLALLGQATSATFLHLVGDLGRKRWKWVLWLTYDTIVIFYWTQ